MVLYVILLFLIGLMHQASADPAGWLEHRSTYYYFSTEEQTPTVARSTCQASGADLLSVENEAEQNFINQHISTGYSIGLWTNQPISNKRDGWYWTDGTSYNAGAWHNWEDRKPDNSAHKYARLFFNGTWRNQASTDTYKFICKKKDICATQRNQCVHGTCHVLHDRNEYRCDCYQDYSWRYCETEINSCLSNPCGTGQCTDGNNTFTCDCTGTGFQGDTCNEDIDECESGAMRCLKGGSCENIIGSARCICVSGATGQMCETDINECESNPCLHGVCTNRNNAFKCDCKDSGYEGERCQSDINECETKAKRCLNGGTCINEEGSARCECVKGITGEECESELDECESSPCFNGKCKDMVNQYVCSCESGFDGIHCERDIDECSTNRTKTEYCVNGECSNKFGSYNCNCTAGYGGRTCNELIDDMEDPYPDLTQLWTIFYISLGCAILFDGSCIIMGVIDQCHKRRWKKESMATQRKTSVCVASISRDAESSQLYVNVGNIK